MYIVSTAGTGRRTLYRRDLMEGVYEPPGIEFAPADEHGHDTDHPVAECRKEVGEPLCERYGSVQPLGAVVDAEDSSDTEPTEASRADADDPEEDAPLVERDPEQLTDIERMIDSAGYTKLRKVAARIEGVNGSGATADMRVGLHAADEEHVAEAFAAVEDETESESDINTEES